MRNHGCDQHKVVHTSKVAYPCFVFSFTDKSLRNVVCIVFDTYLLWYLWIKYVTTSNTGKSSKEHSLNKHHHEDQGKIQTKICEMQTSLWLCSVLKQYLEPLNLTVSNSAAWKNRVGLGLFGDIDISVAFFYTRKRIRGRKCWEVVLECCQRSNLII